MGNFIFFENQAGWKKEWIPLGNLILMLWILSIFISAFFLWSEKKVSVNCQSFILKLQRINFASLNYFNWLLTWLCLPDCKIKPMMWKLGKEFIKVSKQFLIFNSAPSKSRKLFANCDNKFFSFSPSQNRHVKNLWALQAETAILEKYISSCDQANSAKAVDLNLTLFDAVLALLAWDLVVALVVAVEILVPGAAFSAFCQCERKWTPIHGSILTSFTTFNKV